ncbi:unnamed protein product [Parnassius apollo]|uniref:(apollo) hypothetical protein n=1 Tax=Parnassius apollo TaxID=110799 RepID=A0A8S3W0P0_PARAO|nr:unnamed protein product [Parnassius apollo]
MLTTLDQPEMIEVTNRRGQKRKKPKEIARYNSFMSGIDRADQMISYYSCPRKTIRWYKKAIFYMLDVAAWNAFFLFKKYVIKKNVKKYGYVEYRDKLIRSFTKLGDVVGKDLVSVDAWKRYPPKTPDPSTSTPGTGVGYWPIRIAAHENSKKKYSFLNCRVCLSQEPKRRREISYRCSGCPKSSPLCPECFETWHSISNPHIRQ